MEVEDEMIRITVLIAGRPYPLKINKKDEAVVRRLVKEANEKIQEYQQIYKKDKQDLLAMTLLIYAMDLHKAQAKSTSNIPIHHLSDSIQEVDKLLDVLLEETRPE